VLPPYEEFPGPRGQTRVEFSINTRPPKPEADIWVLQQRKERFWVEQGVHDLRHHGVVTVADCDDNYLELPTYNPAFLGTHPYKRDDGVILSRAARRRIGKELGEPIGVNKANRDYMHQTFGQVDAITVSTPYLADLYGRYNPNITVIRNYLDWDMWSDVKPQYEVERSRLAVGYMGKYTYRQGDLDVLKPVVRPFLLKHKDVCFVATEQIVHDYLDVPRNQQVTTGSVGFRSMRLPEITAVMDIGLVPLAMNGLNEAKSHLKGMEYNACGIPFIASPTESYKEYWCDGKNGLLVGSEEEWRDSLELLVSDRDLVRSMGAWGREKAAQYTIQEHAGEWEALYLSLLGGEAEQLARQAVARGAIQKVSELAQLVKLLDNRRPRTVVEIGSAAGGTFWLWCQLAHPKALLVSIDLPGGDYGGSDKQLLETLGFDRYGPRRSLAKHLKENQTGRFIQADSQLESTRLKLEAYLAGRKIDLLMIDADHAYQGVKRDFELYQPLVVEDGLTVFHDILPHNKVRVNQVHKLWAEIKHGYRHVEFASPREEWGWGKWGGLGVLFNQPAKQKAA
jgi:glycosyltransferase involved in cell wall biosynthesis/23S rRNA U2552 (ribose-2'-O)-methylase RlmE/FtsJ